MIGCAMASLNELRSQSTTDDTDHTDEEGNDSAMQRAVVSFAFSSVLSVSSVVSWLRGSKIPPSWDPRSTQILFEERHRGGHDKFMAFGMDIELGSLLGSEHFVGFADLCHRYFGDLHREPARGPLLPPILAQERPRGGQAVNIAEVEVLR